MTFPRKTEGGLLPKRAEDGGGHAAFEASNDTNEGYVAEKIVAKEKTEFLVRWQGYGPEDDNWEPPASLPQYLIDQFELPKILRHKSQRQHCPRLWVMGSKPMLFALVVCALPYMPRS